jgi:hypothetical protein
MRKFIGLLTLALLLCMAGPLWAQEQWVVPSRHLPAADTVLVFKPKGYSPKSTYAVLYLLHGYSQNFRQWRAIVNCGTADVLQPMNNALKATCDSLQLPLTYTTQPGGHDEEYWKIAPPGLVRALAQSLKERRLLGNDLAPAQVLENPRKHGLRVHKLLETEAAGFGAVGHSICSTSSAATSQLPTYAYNSLFSCKH